MVSEQVWGNVMLAHVPFIWGVYIYGGLTSPNFLTESLIVSWVIVVAIEAVWILVILIALLLERENDEDW